MSNLITADIMLLQDRAPMPDENGLTPGTAFNSANHPLAQQEAVFNRIGTSMYKDGFAAKSISK